MQRRLDFIKEGDVLLIYTGKLCLVEEMDSLSSDMIRVLYIDSSDSSFVDKSNFYADRNLGQSKEVVAQFHIGHSIHVRLNRLGAV